MRSSRSGRIWESEMNVLVKKTNNLQNHRNFKSQTELWKQMRNSRGYQIWDFEKTFVCKKTSNEMFEIISNKTLAANEDFLRPSFEKNGET